MTSYQSIDFISMMRLSDKGSGFPHTKKTTETFSKNAIIALATSTHTPTLYISCMCSVGTSNTSEAQAFITAQTGAK